MNEKIIDVRDQLPRARVYFENVLTFFMWISFLYMCIKYR